MTESSLDDSVLAPFVGKRVLITGAFGFLGGHVCRHMVAAGASVTALDTDTAPTRPSQLNLVPGLRERVSVCTGDVTDAAPLERCLSDERFDYVFHFAAFASVIQRAAERPVEAIRGSSMGVVHVLDAIRKTGQDITCFVHASSDKVYGGINGSPYCERSTPLLGAGIYEASKIAADVFAHSYGEAFGIPVVVARMCNVFGPFDLDAIRYRLVPKAFAAMFGSPTAAPAVYAHARAHRRDYLFIDDCCSALLLLASRAAGGGDRAFNLPGRANLTTAAMCAETVEAASAVATRSGDPALGESIRANGYRVVEVPSDAVREIVAQENGGQRLRAATGFEPRFGIREGLERTAEFYRDYARQSVDRDGLRSDR